MNYEKIIASVVLGVSLIAIGYFFNQTLAKKVEYEAVDQCSRVAVSTWYTEDGNQAVEPLRPVYEQCLKDKGIEVEQKAIEVSELEATESGELDEN